MKQAKKGDTVKIHYTGMLEDGTVFDSSVDGDPLEFTIGEGKVIPVLEQAVIGMNPKESKSVKIPADQAYGPYDEDRVVVVDRTDFPENVNLKIGDRLDIPDENGHMIRVTVTDVSESSATLDGNHPLAREDITFDIQLIDIL